MNPKKIILCPNPSRDYGMRTTRDADAILREMGFQTVVCSPFRETRPGAFADYPGYGNTPSISQFVAFTNLASI